MNGVNWLAAACACLSLILSAPSVWSRAQELYAVVDRGVKRCDVSEYYNLHDGECRISWIRDVVPTTPAACFYPHNATASFDRWPCSTPYSHEVDVRDATEAYHVAFWTGMVFAACTGAGVIAMAQYIVYLQRPVIGDQEEETPKGDDEPLLGGYNKL